MQEGVVKAVKNPGQALDRARFWNRTADIVGSSDLNTGENLNTNTNGQPDEAGSEIIISCPIEGITEPDEVYPGQELYEPKSTLLKQNWPPNNTFKIEYGDGKVLTKVLPPPNAVRSGQFRLGTMGDSNEDIRSLRSREAAILGTQGSVKATDYLLQESLRESIKESLMESALELELPIFKRLHMANTGSFTDDFATGVYIGQVNHASGKK